jgi:lipoate-protein ligase A
MAKFPSAHRGKSFTMPLEIRDYDLADRDILERVDTAFAFLVWQPAREFIVIGKGNKPEQALFDETILADGLPVLRRPSGGEAVILTPDMLCVSAVRNTTAQQPSRWYFRHYNGLIRSALEARGVSDVDHRGISDLALGGRKILGSSIYRNKHRVFYHAVLNVAGTTDPMERYLRMPQREPDYRRLRPHREFVTSLRAQGYTVPMDDLRRGISAEFALSGLDRIEKPAD